MGYESNPVEQVRDGANQECLSGEVKCTPLLIALSGVRAKLLNGRSLSADNAISRLRECQEGPIKGEIGACGGKAICRHPAVQGITGSNEQAAALLNIIVE
jgi:hypothetical protein